MLYAFNPPIAPSPGTSVQTRVALNTAEFGDGYTQSSPRGLNHIRETLTLSWAGLTPEQFTKIKGFFVEQGGNKPFAYTPTGYDGYRVWTCSEWTFKLGAPFSFNATLSEFFSPETLALIADGGIEVQAYWNDAEEF